MAYTMYINGTESFMQFTNSSTSLYTAITGGNQKYANAIEAETELYYAGTFSMLQTRIETNSMNATCTIRLKKNDVNGNMNLSIAAATTGIFTDTTNTDSVAVADGVCLVWSKGSSTTGLFNIKYIKTDFDTNTSTTNTISKIRQSCNATALTGASTTYYLELNGNQGGAGTTENLTQAKMQYSGTFRNLGVEISANSRTTTTTVRLRKNTANGSQNISVLAGTTGLFADTTNTDAAVANDLFNFSVTNGTGTQALTVRYIDVDWQTTTDPGVGLLMAGNRLTAVQWLDAVTTYLDIAGSISDGTFDYTEAATNMNLDKAYTFKGLTVNVIANGIAATSTVTFRKNTASTAMAVSIGSNTTGQFQDVTDSVTTVINDDVCLQFVRGTEAGSNYISIGSILIWTEIAGTAPSSINMDVTDSIDLVNKFITKV